MAKKEYSLWVGRRGAEIRLDKGDNTVGRGSVAGGQGVQFS